jgi:ABC-2 type transport system ATP-binding protein
MGEDPGGYRMHAVEVTELRRTFSVSSGIFRRARTDVEALKGISFHIERGELFGLLGPNGAGKTTTIKILTTLLAPTSGSARVLGLDADKDRAQLRRRVGYVFGGDRGLYDRLSALDNLRYFAELYELDWRTSTKRIADVLELVGLTGRENERVEGYSRGMRQRLHIARGILHEPEVLFLDEPTIGVDPVGARDLRRMIADLAAAGTTILLTTHYMFEADELCSRLAVIAKGRLVAEGAPSHLKASATGRITEVETFGIGEERIGALRELAGVHSVTAENRDHASVLVIRTDSDSSIAERVLARLADERVGRVTTREPTLEDAYISIVSEAGE